MTPFKSILAATDFSAPATNAVRRAALLAAQGPLPRAAAISIARPDPVHATPGFSWMRAQLPAEAFMATQHGRPGRAGG